MTQSLDPSRLAIRLIAQDPPGNCYGDSTPVVIGVQRATEVEQVVTATETAQFSVEVTVVDDGNDFRGPYVHGRRGDRFLYMVWGLLTPSDTFSRFARSKVMLNDIPDGLRRSTGERRLVCTIQATRAGGPASGRLQPSEISWAADRRSRA